MHVLVNRVDVSQYVRQETIEADWQIGDPMDNVKFTVEDPGAAIFTNLDCLQEVVLLAEPDYANSTQNVVIDPTFQNMSTYYSVSPGSGSVTSNTSAGTATLSVSHSGSFTQVTLTQTSRVRMVVPGQQYCWSIYLNSSQLTGAKIGMTYQSYKGDGTTSASHTDFQTTTTGGWTRYSTTISTAGGVHFIQMQLALVYTSGTSVNANVTTKNWQLELMQSTSSFSYPTPDCIPGATNCFSCGDQTTVRQNRLFCGILTVMKSTYVGANRLYEIEATGPELTLSKVLVSVTYNNTTDSAIIFDLIDNHFIGYLSDNNVSEANVHTYDQISWQDVPVKEIITTLSGNSGYQYFIDPYLDFHYQPPGATQTAFGLSDSPDMVTTFPYQDFEYTRDATSMSNVVLVSGDTSSQGVDGVVPVVYNGDGFTTQFTVPHQIHHLTNVQVTKVTTSGGNVTSIQNLYTQAGMSGVDGSNPGVLVDKRNKTITFSGAPASGTQIIIQYTYLNPSRAWMYDGGSVGTYAFNFYAKVDDSSLLTSSDVHQRALYEIKTNSTPLQNIQLKCDKFLQVGDTVSITSTADTLIGAVFVIQQVKMRHLGTEPDGTGYYEYDVQLGPYRADFIHQLLHIHRKVKSQSSNVGQTPALYYVAAQETVTYAESVQAAIGAGSSTYGTDTFAGRSASGGFGTASDGQGWALSVLEGNAQVQVSGGEGQIWAASSFFFFGSSTTQVLALLGSGSVPNAEAKIRMQAGDFSNIPQCGLVLRYLNANNYYLAAVNFSNGGPTLCLYKMVSGSLSLISSVSISVTAGAYGWLRFHCSGTGMDLKWWLDGTSEPASYTLSVTDGAVSGSGQFGIMCTTSASSSSTGISVDHYNVTAA